MEVLELGRALLLLATVLTGLIFLLSLFGIALKDRRWVLAARAGFYALLVVVSGSTLTLIYAFVAGIYDCDYVFNYSEKLLPVGFKIAGLWGGLKGSLLFWTFLTALFSAALAFQHRYSSAHPTGRRLEPYTYLVLAAVTFFFSLVTYLEGPFELIPPDQRVRLASLNNIALDENGSLLDGSGLNQQLVNYWFVIHPPTLYLGFTAWVVPFALALAALLAGELGDYWIKVVRRWTMVAWIFLTSGIILGGLWAYRQLGWGGYWAWDPVENASFLPWLTGTAFLHSIMIQERRDMLKAWNIFLIGLSFFLTIVGTWMTRSGVVDSIHAFAGGDIGTRFQIFLFVVAGISLLVFMLRFRQLRGTDSLESLLSREAAFFFNNWILVLLCAVVFFLSFYDKIAHDWFGKNLKNTGIFTWVTAPLFAMLLFLTAVGPLLGWVKTSPEKLRKNFAWPLGASLAATIAVYIYFGAAGILGAPSELVPGLGGGPSLARYFKLESPHPTALYPTGLFIWLCFFIFSTVGYELLRGLRSRVRDRGEDLLTAFMNLVVRQNRRYGGYVVHVGLALLALGIVISSMFKVKVENVPLAVGQSVQLGAYEVTAVEKKLTDEPRPGEPYLKDEVLFRIEKAVGGPFPTAHGAADAADSVPRRHVADLHAERRFYPKKQQWISEVNIHRSLFQDVYIYYPSDDASGRILLTLFLNPFMMFIYLGWFTMIGGAIFAALPIPGSKVGLSE